MYYSVGQIAEILRINPETVRRWIREGKLRAEQSSKKEGNLISEAAVMEFLSRYPKYNERMGNGYLFDSNDYFPTGYSYPSSYTYGSDYMQLKLQEIDNEISALSKKIHEYEYSIYELQQLINADRQRIESLINLKTILERR